MIWSFLLTAWGCFGLLLVGSGRKSGWYVNLGLQVAWATYGIVSHQYGFILGSMAYGAVNYRNLRRHGNQS